MTILSIEPLRGDAAKFIDFEYFAWAIIGAETGNRKGKIAPRREWVENIVGACKAAGVPVFMKDSLADIWGGPLLREFPWEK